MVEFYDFRERVGSGVDGETEDLARAVIGAAIEVHRVLGPGLPENAYKRAMSLELDLRGIPHRLEVPVPIQYKGTIVGEGRIDILVDERLVLELKSADGLSPVHAAQALSYLRVMGLQLALVINFNEVYLRNGLKRVVNTK